MIEGLKIPLAQANPGSIPGPGTSPINNLAFHVEHDSERPGGILVGSRDDWEAREAALRAEIAEHAAAGREAEREHAAWRLAASIMCRTLSGGWHERED